MSERHLGQTLGKYRIEELIGSGGFAWVYKAFDPELEIHVALKVLKPQFAGDPTFEERFRREAATAAKLRHPNIIKIYAVGRHSEAVYFAMDYYPSGLAERLEVANSLPEEFVVRVGLDVAQALGYAHREGVIHRDIKVDNILFDAHGNAVVADFGIARAVTGYTGQTGTNMVVGTPQYFAPEQARAKSLDGRADIYSLGVTLYRAATGRLPFEGDDWYEIARQHVEEQPPPPRTINPDLTPAFESAVLHCLQKLPDDRPATGELFAQELATLLPATLETSAYRTRFTGSEPTVIVRTDSHAVTPSNGTEPVKRSSGTPWIVGATAVAVLALGMRFFIAPRTGEPTQPPAVRPESAVPVAPPPPVVAPPVVPNDSGPRDSVKPPPPTTGRIIVTSPDNATITFQGKEVAAGNGWRSDTLKPGSYQVSATVPAPPGCSSATATTQLTIRAGARVPVKLEPRSCGRLLFSSRYSDARWTLTLLPLSDNNTPRTGTVPANVLLPVGDYQRVISRVNCASFIDTIPVQPNKTDSQVPRNPIC